MRFVDDRKKEYELYLPELTKREDFEEFWRQTITLSKSVTLGVTLEKVDYPSPYVDVYDLTYKGYDGTDIKGWYMIPKFTKSEKLPCLIHYHGFTNGRNLPHEYMPWIMMGMVVIVMECRLQGGDTGSNVNYPGGLFHNVNSLGILDKSKYYYRAVYMDAMRAIDFAVSCENVDSSKIILHGASQGGALVMAMAALDERAALAIADVPSNSNIEARIEGEHGSFQCLTDYIRRYPNRWDTVYETVSYYDTMNMADKIKCPVLASVALKDNICPAKCYYATYNRITAQKDIVVYPFNGHDGCGMVHMQKKLEFIKEHRMIGY
ncbi:acetylxylan esterase [Anaeromicropila herbilytica]|uniref:Cephalosporin-C deacetylase n=1 Tax=Anaeromicropila herbilytica TaxID=2785025 RepID=A0A7R7EMJ6_9FIRM|nr:acetylxylan esterase [Anaeromicropila herbilytica]BCN31616.1 cephalosporin-C deacetylase [Anaeromicropila herbilytica]